MLRYEKGTLSNCTDELPLEQPVKLTVNGREIATLVASPHDLRFLVAGFLRTQGFVRTVDDFLALGVCDDSGAAAVRIRGELPERLTPVLTSGCGAGISFTLNAGPARPAPSECRFTPETIFAMMREMAHLSERYGRHGGIHSAAVSDGSRILFHAEDLGRHNTIDRLAGHALLAGVDLAGMLLLTSGRVSAEMATKAASLGVALIASRTSPTTMALRICRETGIGLIGYVRGDSFRIAACPERVILPPQPRISGVAGVILAGGGSRRMGTNKALMNVAGQTMIEAVYRTMAGLFDEVLVVTSDPDAYADLPCRKIADLYPGKGPLAGIHAALTSCAAERIFVVGCDMPSLNPELIRMLCSRGEMTDAVVPVSPDGLEPLHALYGKNGMPELLRMLEHDERSVLTFIKRINSTLIATADVAACDPHFRSFKNINTPEEFSAYTTTAV